MRTMRSLGQRPLREGRSAGDVPHLAPRRGPRSCRRGAGRRPARPASCGQSATSSPIRLVISASEWRSVAPSGQPATARMWFSNWLTAQAVDGPVAGVVHARGDLVDQQRLGRRRSPEVEHLHRQHADVAERVGDGRRRCRGRAPRCGRRQARGTAEVRRMPPSWCWSGRRRSAISPSTAAHEQHRDLALEGDAALEHRRRAADLVERRRLRRSPARCAPGPCRRSRGGASSGWPARRPSASAAAKSSGPSTAAKGATGMPSADDELLLRQPVLRHFQRLDAGPHRHARRRRRRRPRRARSRTRR